MLQGEIIETTITGLNNEGEGIARVGEDAFVVFVPDALPGERVSIRLVTVKKKYAVAKLLKRFNASPDRIEPRCPAFGKCGGCSLQHMNYDAQLKLKTQTVFDALSRIGGAEKPKVDNCVASPLEWNYRNKASVPAQKDFKTAIKIGFYKKRSHDVVPFVSCPVLYKEIENEIISLKNYLETNKFQGYNEKQTNNVNNFIRHIVFRYAFSAKEMLGCIVANRKPNDKETIALKKLKATSRLKGLILNENTDEGNFIWGKQSYPIFGSSVLQEKLGDMLFDLEVSSFFQVNPKQAFNIYTYVAQISKEYAAQNILELYAGIGTLTCFLAQNAKHVTAIESWRAASKFILHNAKLNGLNNITAFEDTAENVSSKLSDKTFDTVVLDPPRTGCDKSVIDSIIKISPERIIYVSCNPATLARDYKLLAKNGYKLISARPFDMFPQTGHVETVALLIKQTGSFCIETEHLKIYTASKDMMEKFIASQTNDALRTAYSEMLKGCLEHPEQWEWYAIWMIELKDGTHIGELCFKGLDSLGSAEIGYGILPDYQGYGYATEAVIALSNWALNQSGVTNIKAEADKNNIVSQKVLEKSGFMPTGTLGNEGPIFIKNK